MFFRKKSHLKNLSGENTGFFGKTRVGQATGSVLGYLEAFLTFLTSTIRLSTAENPKNKKRITIRELLGLSEAPFSHRNRHFWPKIPIFSQKITLKMLQMAPNSDSFFCYRGFSWLWVEWYRLEDLKVPPYAIKRKNTIKPGSGDTIPTLVIQKSKNFFSHFFVEKYPETTSKTF